MYLNVDKFRERQEKLNETELTTTHPPCNGIPPAPHMYVCRIMCLIVYVEHHNET